ncbi:ATM1-type heavy metal exporter [Zhongshania aliphaticivorans]|uniref:ATM1-type heavy metal exporter n=1 Tax=Zhongshania aliphaticivorans TaxID=1470434 RepID=A0A5S9MYZ6_9GAMM|nr:ABC transporter ATP-binding protein/permease [Zhongshania aliphaticivorans]CAA0082116.1 ATM1-type heavy metal exporter [Zhongshania aliphaticivorans]CAA0084567.1 ATM1-type heavy metal exporter [Zhongshania aliphaticivorans]
MRHGTSYSQNQDVNWSTLRELLPYLMAFRSRIGMALLCLIAAKIASVGLPFILKNIVDQLDGNDQSALLILPIALLIAYGIVRFANVLFGELRDTIFGRVTERAMRQIGLTVFKHLHALDLEFHLNRRTGGLSRDIERGTNGINFLLRFMVFNIVPTFIEIGLVISILGWQYSIWFAVIVFVAVICYVGFSVFATEWRTGFIRRANEAESRSSSRAVDSLLNFETVKYFGNEYYEANRYDNELESWELARRQNRLSLFALNAGQALIIATAMTAAMVLAASEVVAKSMTLGDFVLINAFMMQIFVPLNFLGFVYREMKGSMANIEAMFALLRQKATITDIENAPQLLLDKGKIEVKNLSFRYQSERPILNNINFTVAAKQKVAIVGSSGAGKSTLLKLLFRFYDASEGQILIDGQDIKTVNQSSLRCALGIVPQDTVLFNQSILENIRYGRIDASDEDVLSAIRMAHLSEFIDRLPNGVDTLVGERGLKLSGGEKQRVAIARALLKQSPIMIFDEATSSLDSASERLILEAIRDIAQEHTMLVIAHRLSTIVDADHILVLEQGEIVEHGTHTELLKLNGQYAHLWSLQQRERAINSI